MSKKNHNYRSWTEVDLKKLAENIQNLKSFLLPQTAFLQVVKADAYGHGAVQTARVAMQNGATMLGVANVEEALQLRLVDINIPILLMSPSIESEIPQIIKYNLTPSVTEYDFARKLSERAQAADKFVKIHIEIDTGMGRTGIYFREASNQIQKIAGLPNIILEGIFSHFPISEVPESQFCYIQIERFQNITRELEREGIRFAIKHMANSGGIVNYPESHFDMVRAGLMTYGQHPDGHTVEKIDIKPVMSFKTQVLELKTLPEGFSISYGQTYITDQETDIAVLPIGYGDGYNLLLSNNGEVLIRGKRCPIIGRVTMDLTIVDVSHISDVEIGDEVVIIGEQGEACINATEIAERINTINYEILCAVGRRAPRVYVHETVQEVSGIKYRKNILDNLLSNAQLDEIIADLLKVRLNEEIGTAVYHGILESIFGRDVEQMEFRENFQHDVIFLDFGNDTSPDISENYYKVIARVSYKKRLRSPELTIACATNTEKLNQLFESSNCEYRWLIEQEKAPTKEDFEVVRLRIGDLEITDFEEEFDRDSYIIKCSHPDLESLVDQDVSFMLETKTKHPKASHHFPIYIVQPTKGMQVDFYYEEVDIENIEVINFFAGKDKYPKTEIKEGFMGLKISETEWIFPNSGIIFMWD